MIESNDPLLPMISFQVIEWLLPYKKPQNLFQIFDDTSRADHEILQKGEALKVLRC